MTVLAWSKAGLRANCALVFLVLFVAVTASGTCLYIYLGMRVNPPIRSDGFGYYAYLPSIFLHHNVSFTGAEQAMPPGTSLSETYGIGLDRTTGHLVNKYPIGTSVLASPFFLMAALYSLLARGVGTGYATAYQAAMVVSGIFYLCAGTAFTYLSARRFVATPVALLSTLLIVYGTNVFHYGTFDSSF
jgi:hypothetical protein